MSPPAKRWIVEQLAASPFVASGPIGALWRFVSHDVWLLDIDTLPWWKRRTYRTARILFLAARSFHGDRCMVQASALTYVTVLSLVPLLAFAFAMLKGLGFYQELRTNYIDPYLDELLQASGAPADPSAATGVHGAADLRHGIGQVLDLVEQTDLKGLGFLGLIVLLVAVHRLLGSIEGSFNEIWGVSKSRSWVRKLSDYLTMVIVTPLFLVIAIGVTTALQSHGVVTFLREQLALGLLIEGLIKCTPVLVGWAAFTLVYLVLPNRRGKLSSAAIGGFVGGVLWQLALEIQIRLQVGIANYNAIYASFAALPVFLVWVQTSWVIVLLGAELAFAHESEPDYRGVATYEEHDHAFKEQVALRALTRVCAAFVANENPPSAASIAAQLSISPREVQEVLDQLQRGRLVASTDSGGAAEFGFLPARDPGKITVVDVLHTMRGAGFDPETTQHGELDGRVDRALAQLNAEARSSAYNRTLRDLVEDARRRDAVEAAGMATQPGVQGS
jgi:membrane protein